MTGARAEIARLWAAVTDAGFSRVEVSTDVRLIRWGDRYTEACEAEVFARMPPGGFARAYGVDEAGAVAALLDLVRLLARLRRDEIDAAPSAGDAW